MTVSYRWTSDSAETTHTLGQIAGKNVAPGMVIALCGDLGAGKTTMTKGIAVGLGVTARVTSPTFVFVNEYPTASGHILVHVDSYRLGDTPDRAAVEAFALGMDEILERDDVIVLIEWADLIQSLLPEDHLRFTIQHTPETPDMRKIVGVATGSISTTALKKIAAHIGDEVKSDHK